jgi:hypothetical protein
MALRLQPNALGPPPLSFCVGRTMRTREYQQRTSLWRLAAGSVFQYRMWHLHIFRSKVGLATLALTILVPSFCLLRMGNRADLPKGVAIRGELSNAQAESLYTSNARLLRTFYWRRVRANIAAGQFKEAWLNLQRGPERIHTVSREPDGWFVLCATNRQGNSCTIRTRELAAPPNTVLKFKSSSVVAGRVVLSDRAQPDGARAEINSGRWNRGDTS